MNPDSERDPLLKERQEVAPSYYLKTRLLLVPVVIFYYSSLGMYGYVISVYYHHTIRDAIRGSNRSQTIDVCNQSKSGPDYEEHVHVQQETAKWTIYFSVATYVPAIFGNLIWGAYSDIMGRRKQFMISISGTLLRIIISTIAVKLELSFVFLIIASAIDGALGSFMGVLSATCACVADVSTQGKKRTWHIVGFEILIGLSLSIVLFVTGVFLEKAGYFYPLLASCLLLTLALAYVLCVLPETLTLSRQRADNPSQQQNCLKAIGSALRLIIDNGLTYKQPKFIVLSLAFIPYSMTILSRGTLEVIYQLGPPFCWTPQQLSWFGGAKSAISCIANVGGTFLLHKCLNDDTIALIAGTTGIFAFIVEGLATSSTVLYTVPVLQALSFLPVPIIRSLLSQLSSNDTQGMLFGSIGLLDTLCGLLGALTTNLVYETTMSIMTGLVFLLCAGLSALGMAFLGVYMVMTRVMDRQPTHNRTAASVN